ncbi:MAG: right-handed parallel beta-helix repeat-containing protein [Gemmatimonadaceae bacterium]
MSVTKKAAAATLAAVTLLGAAACDRPVESVSGLKPVGPNFATALAEGEAMRRIVLTERDETGAYLLNRVCDVFIGEPVVDPVDGAPQRYDHQVVVELPADAPANPTIKLVGDAAMQASGSKLFTCDAVDRDADGNPILDANGQEQPVIDPVTLHAAKGDAPQVTTNGVTLDLNGYSITVSPAFGDPGKEAFENIGVVLAGEDQTLTNSANEVSKIYGFGHNVDIEAVRPKVLGKRWDGDGDPTTVDWVYNIETRGGFGIRLSDGPALIDQVKSVNLDPVEGQGFEARRMSSGILTVTNSHFEGGTEGAFLREVSGVTFKDNYVSGRSGPGIATRQAVSTSTRPIQILGNTVVNSTVGVLWGRDSRNNAGLKIEGNKISQYTTCGVGRSSRNTTIAPLTMAGIAAVNTFDRATAQTCTIQD